MPIYKNNIIFIHIPKTGGTYIEKQLENYTSQKLFGYSPKLNAYLQHCYYSEYKYMIKTWMIVFVFLLYGIRTIDCILHINKSLTNNQTFI